MGYAPWRSLTLSWFVDPIRRVPASLKVALAKEMRRAPTQLERMAWELLRNRAILNLKFRRQHVLAGFIVDFVSLSAKIILEVDGPLHRQPHIASYDQARTAWLEAAGYRVIRVREPDLTAAKLEQLLLPFIPPLPKGEGVRG